METSIRVSEGEWGWVRVRGNMCKGVNADWKTRCTPLLIETISYRVEGYHVLNQVKSNIVFTTAVRQQSVILYNFAIGKNILPRSTKASLGFKLRFQIENWNISVYIERKCCASTNIFVMRHRDGGNWPARLVRVVRFALTGLKRSKCQHISNQSDFGYLWTYYILFGYICHVWECQTPTYATLRCE